MYDEYRKCTATNLFIVPLLGISRNRLTDNGMENAYIKDEIKGIDYDRGVYLLLRPLKQEKFALFLQEERARKAKILDEYDYPDGWTMLVYQYDEEYEKDVQKIMRGKFSRTSERYKEKIPKTLKIQKSGVSREILTMQHEVFKKSTSLENYWAELYGLEFDYYHDEYYEFYAEREVLTQELLNKLI